MHKLSEAWFDLFPEMRPFRHDSDLRLAIALFLINSSHSTLIARKTADSSIISRTYGRQTQPHAMLGQCA